MSENTALHERISLEIALGTYERDMAELEELRKLMPVYQSALQQIATFPRGGVIITGTPGGDRDEMIGLAREALPRHLWLGAKS